jgi:hypothetical protein
MMPKRHENVVRANNSKPVGFIVARSVDESEEGSERNLCVDGSVLAR